VHVLPVGTAVHSVRFGPCSQTPEQQTEDTLQNSPSTSQLVDWQMLLMQPSPAVQHVLPAVQAAPEAMQAVQVPLTQV
jgi:hypothetical protein